MTIRPIIFSTPMVQALLAGRKTQTRRLASSPLRRVEAGDLLYVRETLECANGEAIGYPADGQWLPNDEWRWRNKTLPSIHMPRWASRLTLEVSRVHYDRLQRITPADSVSEGIQINPHGNRDQWVNYPLGSSAAGWTDPCDSFRTLWNSLHTTPGERWEDNPMIVALTFTVHRANVDQVAAGKAVA